MIYLFIYLAFIHLFIFFYFFLFFFIFFFYLFVISTNPKLNILFYFLKISLVCSEISRKAKIWIKLIFKLFSSPWEMCREEQLDLDQPRHIERNIFVMIDLKFKLFFFMLVYQINQVQENLIIFIDLSETRPSKTRTIGDPLETDISDEEPIGDQHPLFETH